MSNYVLIDETLSRSWTYDSEVQLKTVVRLYGAQHPRSSLSVVIAGRTHKVR